MNPNKRAGEQVLVRVLVRGLLLGALDEISTADAKVRQNRREGVPDDPKSIKKLRIAFRRIQYELSIMSEIDKSLAAKSLIRQLRQVGKPLGRLRDAEVLGLQVSKALGSRANTPEGRELLEVVTLSLVPAQQVADEMLDSLEYQEAINALAGFLATLSKDNMSPALTRPIAQRAVHTLWRNLQREVKHSRKDPSDTNLHSLRIAGKRMLYATKAFSDILGSPAEDVALHVETLQKFLGRQHDHVVVSLATGRVGKSNPRLAALANELSAEERKNADDCARSWVHLWKIVRDLRLRKSLLED